MSRGLRQNDLATIIGCDELTVVNWEKGHRTPRINHMAGVIRFLGYNPLPGDSTIAGRLVAFRKSRGRS